MFNNKIKSLTALKGKQAADITAEEITALNAELSAMDFPGIIVEIAGATPITQADVDAAVAIAVNASEKALTAEHATAIDALNATIATNQTRITELEGMAGVEIVPPKKGDTAHDAGAAKSVKSKDEAYKEKAKAQAKEKLDAAKKYQLTN